MSPLGTKRTYSGARYHRKNIKARQARGLARRAVCYFVRFRGKADMGRRTVPIISAAYDPKRTSVVGQF
jgi:hypothetical protein